MKKLSFVLFFSILSFVGFSQKSEETEDRKEKKYTKKYFVATNSGMQSTPIGFRVGFLDKRGGYIGARFGKGYNYEDKYYKVTREKATLFSTTVGMIFPVFYQESAFKAHAFVGIGYGHWFNRLSENGTNTGAELEAGMMLSYSKLLISVGGNVLAGDGGTPKTDLTVGVGFKF